MNQNLRGVKALEAQSELRANKTKGNTFESRTPSPKIQVIKLKSAKKKTQPQVIIPLSKIKVTNTGSSSPVFKPNPLIKKLIER